jgi:very-short-patch-repair endonuclease
MPLEQAADSPLQVDIEASSELSLAMVENSIPLVARVSLTNTGPDPLDELTVEMALLPDLSSKWNCRISSIPVGGTFNVDDIELPLDREKLVNQLERGAADLAIWVRRAATAAPLASGTRRIDVLAYNEWSRGNVPQLLAAFVLPNHPVVADVLKDARTPLESLTGNPALDGYQSGNPRRIAAMAEAIYQTIQARGITYSNPPASFELTGQKIRTPEQVIGDQVATCLDVSVFVAAALEQAGLHPLIVLVQGHAFPGVWLEDHLVPEGFIDDAAMLRKLVELGRLMIFDSSATVTRPALPISEARRVAVKCLETAPLRCAVDIAGSRIQRFRPLPIRVATGYATVVEVPVATPQSGPAGVPRSTSTDGSGRSRPSARTKHPRVEAWKQRLLDTTLRNRLLNFKDKKESLDLLCHNVGAVEDALASGEELKLRSRPPMLGGDDPRSKKLLEARVADDAVRTFLAERLKHGELYANHPSDATDSKLIAIFRAAREALEETGTNTLCLTIGMLHWFESDTSEEPRRAPILLVPVSMQRNARTNGFTLRSTGEDARLNVTLFEKLRIDTGITVPELSELPLDDAGVDVPAVLNRVRNAILNLRRWEVKDDLHLGLFSFAKFQMWADLDQNLDVLLQNPVIQHLLNGKGDPYPNQGSFPEPTELDAKFTPKDLLCPLDADASQLAAVAAAADAKTFVLQGPPGTGKSQTITNLVTHCIAQGKRVLFVAEKAAALEVVQRRLAQVGLAPYVLELHSHKSGKLQVLEQFRDALDSGGGSEPPTWQQDTEALLKTREHLNTYVGALHKKWPAGFSVFQAIARLNGLRSIPALALPASCADSSERLATLERTVDELAEALTSIGPAAQSAWFGCNLPEWRVDLPTNVSAAVEASLTALDRTHQLANELATALGASPPTTLADVDCLCNVAATLRAAPPHGEALESSPDWSRNEPEGQQIVVLVGARSDAYTRLSQAYAETLFSLDLKDLAARFRKYANAFFLFAWFGLRAARKTLLSVVRERRLPSRSQIADDLEQANRMREMDADIAAREARARALFGEAWSGTSSNTKALAAALDWAKHYQQTITSARPGLFVHRVHNTGDTAALLDKTRQALQQLRSELESLHKILGWRNAEAPSPNEWEQIRSRLERWRGDVRRLRAWHSYLAASMTLEAAGCRALVAQAQTGELGADKLKSAFRRGVYQAWVSRTLGADPILSMFDGETHHKRVTSFAELDGRLLTASQHVARARVAARAPRASMSTTGGEMGVLQKELQKKRGHMPIRKLLAAIPSLASRLKPCFLMSPMSVATYLDPKAPSFDVIVFDEASQIPAHDAVGTLARGRSAVVVGDTKQLPPTAFFQSAGDDEADENEFEELESILNECVAAGLPERKLDWHYRSRHESLIAFSNHHYYKNRLNTFPSASGIGSGRGVTLKQVGGFYDKGGARTNPAEAQTLVADLVARLKGPDASKHTYGVVTFSQAQQKLVEDLLDKARANDPQLEPFFNKETNPEPVIVKNLENIQGDERDVMIFSICYGPDQNGKVSMNFGPLNRDGGERRLNVAVTRAREELIVYSTLRPEQIDLTRTNALGVKHLKTFLDYARRGPTAIAEALETTAADQFDSPFEEQVCERLRGLRFTVHTQVGCAGYRLDMAICHPEEPGRYVLAIECDGAHYHSARSARERDRLRAHVLKGLGWRIHRIWSTDWWQGPDLEIQKVQAAFERAKAELAAPPKVVAAAPPLPPSVQAMPPAVTSTKREDSARVPVPTARPADSGREIYARGVSPIPGVVPYQVAQVAEARRQADDVHDDRYRDELKMLLDRTILVEAPVTLRVLARRIAPYFHIQRSTSRLEDRIRSVLGRTVKIQDDVVWRTDQDPARYEEVRLAPPEARREAQEVPLQEVANAAALVLRGSIALEQDELVKLTARSLGFSRTGERVADHMASGIALLIKRGTARQDGGKVVLC